MPEYPKRVKRLIREYAARAHEAELGKALGELERQFAVWRDGKKGYVTRFQVRAAFLERYPVQVVGNRGHAELWVPAEELGEFNANIVGPIEVIATYAPEDGDG